MDVPNGIHDTEVFPGGTARKNVVYIVPNDETGYALMFDADRYQDNDRAFVLLPEVEE